MAVARNTVKRIAHSGIGALSGGLLTLGLGLQSLQAGRLSTSLYWFTLVVVVGMAAGLGLSLVRDRRIRWALTGVVFVASLVMSMVSQAPVAGALQNDCATVTIGGETIGAQPAGGQLGSVDNPIKLTLDSGQIPATLATAPGYHGVYFGAELVRPLDGPRFSVAGDALDIDPETSAVTATLQVIDTETGLKLLVDGTEHGAPAGVVELAGSFVDDGLRDLCRFSVHVQMVAPAWKAPTGQVGLVASAVGFIGLAAGAVANPGTAKPAPESAREPRGGSRTAWVPDRFAVVATGAETDDPNDKVVKVAVAVDDQENEGFRSDSINHLYLCVSPSPYRTETMVAAPRPGDTTGGYRWLHVVAQHGDRATAQELAVPHDADLESEWIRFPLEVEGDDVDILAVFWDRYSQRVWEAVRISGPATPTGNRALRARSVERQRQAEMVNVHGNVIAPPPTLAIVRSNINSLCYSTDGTTMVRSHQSGATERLALDLADTLNALQAAHPAPIADWTDPVVVDTFAALARTGAALYRNLDLHKLDRGSKVIRVHDISEVNHLPLEFVYDAPLPLEPRLRPECFENLATSLDLTPHVEDLADLGDRVCDCDPGPDTGIVCPGRFWGVSKVIEHFVVSGVQVERSPVATPGRWLPAPRDTLLGATDRAPAQAIVDLHTRLVTWSGADAVIDVRTVDSWTDWRDAIQAGPFDVLLALPHQDKGKMTLELGGVELDYGTALESYLGGDEQLMILLGCATVGELNDGFRSFSSQFLSQGASVVIGSLATLNTRYSLGVASRLMAELRAAAGDGADFGHAMRRVRRGLVEGGYPIGLAIVALGDAAWRFETDIGIGEPTGSERSGVWPSRQPS